MKITFLGSGSAFSMKNFQNNAVVENNGKRLLIDCGTDIRFSLAEQGLSFKDIDAVYLSHLHADHIGGIEYLAFCSYFSPKNVMPNRIKLFGNSGVLDRAWSETLRGGLASIQGKVVDLYDYFEVIPVDNNHSFYWEGIKFDLVQTVHIMDGYSIVPSFGLMIGSCDSTDVVYYTSDAQFCPFQIQTFYDQASIIFQDCETYPFKSGVHANYSDLMTLDDKTKAKMWLMHWNDNIADCIGQKDTEAKRDGFLGFVRKHQSFNIGLAS
jgi:ribonuclease BN (tRNA processing enzyme)